MGVDPVSSTFAVVLSNPINGGGNSVATSTLWANNSSLARLGPVTATTGQDGNGSHRQMNANDWNVFFGKFGRFGDLLPPLLV